MAKIYLFRHGQSEFNLKKIFTGWKDPDLTELGVEQAKFLGELLKDKKIDLAYRSRLIRSKKTLEEVLKFHPECREIIVDDRMIERSYGDLAGQNHQKIIDEFGQEQFEKWHRGWNDRPPNGESFADVEIRVKKFIDDLKDKYAKKDIGIAISAHGNSIRLFRKIMEQATIEETCSWTIGYDVFFEYEI
jgi:2,3-bisphosphoglycerate-dependent phosphoglycerate mutase